MANLSTRVLALILGLALAGSAVEARTPIDRRADSDRRPPRDQPARSPAQPSADALVYDNIPASDSAGFASTHIIVRFAPGVSGAMRREITRSLGGAAYVPARFGGFGRVTVAPGESPRKLVRRFRANPAVEVAALDRKVRAAGPVGVRPAQGDPAFAAQWHNARIRVPEVTSRNSTEGAGVIVAVIDTGVRTDNGAFCLPGQGLGRELDFGGTQFVPGFDFINNNSNATDRGADEDLEVFFGHGTFVASLIAATADNGIAGRGVTPRVSIMPLRVLGRDGFGFFSHIAEAISFAARNGAKVINLSLGGPDADGSGMTESALNEARAAGVVIIAAAGNEGESDGVSFPAAYPQVIAVAATDFDDRRAGYSNAGPEIDISAPAGGSIARIVDPVNNLRDGALAASFLQDAASGQALCSLFWSNGTSFSAPQVAGAAALLAALGVDDPEVIRTVLAAGARDLDAPGFDPQTGHGLLDLVEAHRGLGFSFD